MSSTDEEFLGEDSEGRIMFDTDSNYTSRFVGEGRFVEGAEESTKNNIVKQVGKMFNFGALASKKRGSASISKRGSSLRKVPTKKTQVSGYVLFFIHISLKSKKLTKKNSAVCMPK